MEGAYLEDKKDPSNWDVFTRIQGVPDNSQVCMKWPKPPKTPQNSVKPSDELE